MCGATMRRIRLSMVLEAVGGSCAMGFAAVF